MVWQKIKIMASGLIAIIVLTASNPLFADDYRQMLQQASQKDYVEVIISDWRAITGEIDPNDLGSAITGAIDIEADRQNLLAHISSNGGKATTVRKFRYLKMSALRVNAEGLKAAKSYSGNIKVWENQTRKLALMHSSILVGAPLLWESGYTGKGQIIAILDTGVDVNHPFLGHRIIEEYCFSVKCPNGEEQMVGPNAARPTNRHGTHVAGIAVGKNAEFAGIAPGAKILAMNIFSQTRLGLSASDFDILMALDKVAQLRIEENMPIAAVNMSIGGGPVYKSPCDETPYQQMALLLESVNVAVVAASGNGAEKKGFSMPACASSIISVGAIDKSLKTAKFSNSAAFLDIMAPGVGIISSVPIAEGSYQALDGTSMAAPHVAGAFAVLREQFPKESVRHLLKMLQSGPIISDPANHIETPSMLLQPIKKTEPEPKPKPMPEPAPAPRPEPTPMPEPEPVKKAPGGTIAITG